MEFGEKEIFKYKTHTVFRCKQILLTQHTVVEFAIGQINRAVYSICIGEHNLLLQDTVL